MIPALLNNPSFMRVFLYNLYKIQEKEYGMTHTETGQEDFSLRAENNQKKILKNTWRRRLSWRVFPGMCRDYEGFFAKEIALRRVMSYPPFVKLALVRISLPADRPEAELLAAFGTRIRALGLGAGVRVLGPAPSPLSVLRGRKRFQCLLKGDAWPAIRGVCAEMRKMLAGDKHVRMSVDLDPVDML